MTKQIETEMIKDLQRQERAAVVVRLAAVVLAGVMIVTLLTL